MKSKDSLFMDNSLKNSNSKQDTFYSGYEDWKGWHKKELSEIPSATNKDYFTREMARAGISLEAKILEIGFGNGEFMQWAKVSGCNISGIETHEKLYLLAKERGFNVYFGQITDNINGLESEFDALVSFDVFEHLNKNILLDYFRAMNRLLKHHGKIVLRFPNGQSPFGRYYQYSDLTHQCVITGRAIEQIAGMTGFTFEGCYNAIRIHGKKRRLTKILKYFLRDLLEIVLGHLHFGDRIPLDANLTCVLVKNQNLED